MKAKELIDKLEEIIEEYGDQDVYLSDWGDGYNAPANLKSVGNSSAGIILDA